MADAQAHREAFVSALLERDSAAARRAIEAAAAELALFDVYLEVMRPALYEIGHRWAVRELNVAQEHYATTIAQSLLDVLSARREPVARDGRLAVVTATPDELHSLGARMIADLLEADGWETILLGAGAPAHDVVELVDCRAAGRRRALDHDGGRAAGRLAADGRARAPAAAAADRGRRSVLDRRDLHRGA